MDHARKTHLSEDIGDCTNGNIVLKSVDKRGGVLVEEVGNHCFRGH